MLSTITFTDFYIVLLSLCTLYECALMILEHKFVRVTCKRNKAQGRRAVKPVKKTAVREKDTPENNKCQRTWSCYQMHIRLCVDPVIPLRKK